MGLVENNKAGPCFSLTEMIELSLLRGRGPLTLLHW